MRNASTSVAVATLFLLTTSLSVTAQSFDVLGTRAQGMGGAFVGVADDASAAYWNPAGLARGAFFSLLLDGGAADLTPEGEPDAARLSNWILALSTPALGLSYYRVRATAVHPVPGLRPSPLFQINSLTTHHAGITLVQSLANGIAVGSTIKLVRGVAASTTASAVNAEDLLNGWDLMGRAGNKADLDVGIMAYGAVGSAGVTVRNVTEPAFETGGNAEVRLERQVRAGASVWLLPAWKLAGDVDFTRNRGPLGETRQVAIGTEGQVTRRLAARTGVRINTAGDRGRTPAWSVGASFSVMPSVLMDAQATAGVDRTLRGWSVAGRVLF